jgi:hypothetical protein
VSANHAAWLERENARLKESLSKADQMAERLRADLTKEWQRNKVLAAELATARASLEVLRARAKGDDR